MPHLLHTGPRQRKRHQKTLGPCSLVGSDRHLAQRRRPTPLAPARDPHGSPTPRASWIQESHVNEANSGLHEATRSTRAPQAPKKARPLQIVAWKHSPETPNTIHGWGHDGISNSTHEQEALCCIHCSGGRTTASLEPKATASCEETETLTTQLTDSRLVITPSCDACSLRRFQTPGLRWT